MKHGDFTALAANYAQFRPAYSPFVLESLLSLVPQAKADMRIADIGAGTGIWTRQMAKEGIIVDAVEPNDAMRMEGENQNADFHINWHAGSGEKTPLESSQYDIVSMASSFHWTEFDKAIKEFNRLLKPNALFVALWNTRRIEVNPLLVDIENYLHTLVPQMKRVSSGRSEFCDSLFNRLYACSEFADVLYVEGVHTELQSPAHYRGVWESVNDIQVQAGEENFAKFLNYIDEKTANLEHIEAQYLTRAWIARKKA